MEKLNKEDLYKKTFKLQFTCMCIVSKIKHSNDKEEIARLRNQYEVLRNQIKVYAEMIENINNNEKDSD